MEVGRFTVEKWKDMFLDALSRRLIVSPHHMLKHMTPASVPLLDGRHADFGEYDDASKLESEDGMEVGLSTHGGAIPPRLVFPWDHPNQEDFSEPPLSELLAFELLRSAIEQCFANQQRYEDAVVLRVDSAVANQLGELQMFISRYGSVS